ncbi:MAG: arylamine N-acetyltransferase [Chloroflexales bacterium]|nr:arylamine N-acetyltransferase [Chloroflexales bacterium]
MDIDAYLERIGYDGTRAPTAATLRALQRAHLLAVPFENLDIHAGQPLALDEGRLFEKIVTRRRGGICYELNGLFAALLQALGFPVALLSASDAHADGGYGPPYDHLALRVQAPDEDGAPHDWLADVGWGDTFTVPLRLDRYDVQDDGLRAYRLEPQGDALLVWQRHPDGQWERNYRVATAPHTLEAFAPMFHYHQASPDAPFTRQRLVTQATGDGRATLTPNRLIVTSGHERHEQPVADNTAFWALLAQHFGIAQRA